MDVKVQKKCGRCGRKEEVTVSLEKATELATQEKNEQLNWVDLSGKLAEMVQTTYPNGGPEFIMLTRSQAGYGVGKLENLCNLPGAERNRGCQARVNALLTEIFMENKKERKPRTKKAKSPEAEAKAAADKANGKKK